MVIEPGTFLSLADGLSPEDVRALLDDRTRSDPRIFAFRGLQTLIGPQLDWSWHMDAMTQFLIRYIDTDGFMGIVNVPPRAGKTTLFSSVMPALILGRTPSAKIIFLSAYQSLVEQSARDMLTIMNAPWYRRAFPKTRINKRALTEIRTTARGYRFSTSVGGSITGRGGDYIIIDDPMNADDAESDVSRESANRFIESSVFTRRDQKKTACMLIVGQRLHEDDVSGRTMAKGNWERLSLPAIAQEDAFYDIGLGRAFPFLRGELLQPRREPLSVLLEEKERMGSRRFAAQYLQEPVPADGSLFKREWLQFGEIYVPQPGDQIVQSWDAANKDGDTNDYSVCVTGVVRGKTIHIVDVYRARLPFPGLLKAVVQQATTFGAKKLLIEDAAAGQQLIQMLRDSGPRGVPSPIGITPIAGKIERALIAEARVERKEVILPRRAPWLDTFLHELMGFPFGRHDDQVDAFSQLLRYTQEDYLPRAVPYSMERAQPWRSEEPARPQVSSTAHDPDVKSEYGYG